MINKELVFVMVCYGLAMFGISAVVFVMLMSGWRVGGWLFALDIAIAIAAYYAMWRAWRMLDRSDAMTGGGRQSSWKTDRADNLE